MIRHAAGLTPGRSRGNPMIRRSLVLAVLAATGVAADISPSTSAAWTEHAAVADVEEGMRYAQAEGLYLQARSRMQQAHFIEALDLSNQALLAFPAHPGARQLREEASSILAVRSDRLRMMGRWLQSLGDVATQEQAVRLATLMDSGDKKMSAGDYNGALRDFDTVAIGIRTFPYRFDWGDLPNQIQGKILAAQARAREADLDDRQRAIAKSREKAAAEREMQEAALKSQVDQILVRAQRMHVRKDHRRAAIEAWNAYQLDRRREDARRLYLDARRQAHVQFEDDLREKRPELMARVHEEIHAALIPQAELMVYPENWAEIDRRKVKELTDKPEEPWQKELRDRLDQEVTFAWEDTALDEAVNFLRERTGLNVVIDPKVLSAPPASFSLAGTMRLRSALEMLTKITNLKSSVRNEAIYLSNEAAAGDYQLKLYNITDLVSSVKDMAAPDLSLASAGGEGASFDPFSGAVAESQTEGIDSEQVRRFIESSVAPGTWQNPGVALNVRDNGTLFINHTPQTHQLVEELLRRLRQQQSLMVNVRIRALDVRKAFIEEIGFDWSTAMNILDPQGSGFSRAYNTSSVVGSIDNTKMPGNSMSTTFPGDNGLRIESAYNILNIYNAPQVNMIFTAMEQENDGVVLRSPELTCFNGQRANAQFVRQQAYIAGYTIATGGTAGGVYDPEIEVLNTGDIIDVRPLVSADRKYVTLEVRPSSVSLGDIFIERINANVVIGGGGRGGFIVAPATFPLELPNTEVRTLRSTCRLPDKGSVMLGGFRTGLRQRTMTGIPLLSHIPFLGRLFSKNGLYDENRHLFFLLTVTVLDIGEMEQRQ
jgi:type II secretory pathway component GspD/PulD (secretin)